MFRLALTDRDGEVIARWVQFLEAEVMVPLCDARTARVKFSVHDPIAAQINPLHTMLKAWWRDELVFRGFALTPAWSGGDGTIDVAFIDPSIGWSKNYHRYGDYCVENKIPPDGYGLTILADSAVPNESQLARGVRHPGIYYGYDGADVIDNEELWALVDRGTQVFESIQTMSQSVVGAEWELRPVDEDNPPTVGDADSGRIPLGDAYEKDYFVQFDRYNRQGTDLSDEVVFHYNWGYCNLEDWTHEPAGDEVANYVVQNNPGGESDRIDSANRALAHDDASWLSIGIYERWETADLEYSKPALQQRANDLVRIFSLPVEHFTMGLAGESVQARHYPVDFGIGDYVRAIAKQGYREANVIGRVTRVTLRQTNDEGPKTEVECIPAGDYSFLEDES